MKTNGRRKTFVIKNDELLFNMPSFELSKAKVPMTKVSKVLPESKFKLSRLNEFILGTIEPSFTSIFVKFLLYFYRVFGITFGGLTISAKTNASQISKLWKVFGFANHFLLIIVIIIQISYWTTTDPIFKVKNKDKSLFVWLLIINRFAQLMVIVINSLYLQISGASATKVLLKYPINKKKFLLFVLILFIQIIISSIALVIDYTLVVNFKIIDCILILIERIYLEVFSWTPTVITCFISINTYWYLKSLHKILLTGHLRNAYTISMTRKSFVQIRDQINQIDSKLFLVHLVNSFIAVYGSLVFIYGWVSGGDSRVTWLSSLTLVNNIENVIKFTISCLIHGMVGRNAIKVLSALDDIELQTAHKDVYKEALYFSTVRYGPTFGFTLANIFSYSTTLLTSVCVLMLCYTLEIMQMNWTNSQPKQPNRG